MFVDEYPSEARVVKACLIVAFVALALGGMMGLVQALHRTNLFRGMINSAEYYSVLTAHGVLLALVFTTFFISGLFTWATVRSLGRRLPSIGFSWLWFAVMTVGTVLATVAILGGLLDWIPFKANVLFTFYAPLKAHPLFYVGAALIIVGSWMAGYDWFRTYWRWRSQHPEERIPLQTFMVLVTMLMWYLASIGVAVEVVLFLIPWSLGWIAKVDPLFTRTLFWYFGHPVVYFWLMPAYLVWYTVLPKLSGGRLFSDPLARVVFLLFLLLSTPVGYHHQYVDPGIPSGFKFLAMTNTMFLLLPSLLTAFTVIASIEHGGRQRGGRGVFGWIKKLPWGEPAFAGCLLAGLMFAAGGFSGMVNAGMNLNYLIHNTLWVPGHFHLTVGTAVALTFMAITYWLLPRLTGKSLRFKKIATVQPYLWFVGMTLMSNAMHRAGMAGIPRRTAEPQYRNVDFQGVIGGVWEMRLQIEIGSVLLFTALVLFLVVVVGSWIGRRDRRPAPRSSGLPAPLSGPENSPRILDNLGFWTTVAVVLVVIAYAIPLGSMIADGVLVPGISPIIP